MLSLSTEVLQTLAHGGFDFPSAIEVRVGKLPVDTIEYAPVHELFETGEVPEQMPSGMKGLVIGLGSKSEARYWEERGWDSLDINPQNKPTHVGDANYLAEIMQGGNLNYILTEFLPLSISGKLLGTNIGGRIVEFPTVKYESFFDQAWQLLSPGGKLIVATGHFAGAEQPPEKLSCKDFGELLMQRGFKVQATVTKLVLGRAKDSMQVIWVGEKLDKARE